MKTTTYITPLFALSNIFFSYSQKNILNPVPFNKVEITDSLFRSKIKLQKEVLLPFAFDKTKPAVENLRKTADFLNGKKDDLPFAHRFISSYLYKVMEGASYILMNEKDPELESLMDSIIDFIEGSQEEFGYLYEFHTTGVYKNHDLWGAAGMCVKPYSWVIHSHELYDM